MSVAGRVIISIKRLQARRHAVAEDADGGIHRGDLFFQTHEALRRGVERSARPAERIVGGVGEIANGEVAVGELLLHPCFEIAEGSFAFEQRIAEQQHAVALLDFKRRGEGGGDEREEKNDGVHGDR